MTRLHPDYFFNKPATSMYAGFRKNNKPTEQTFRELTNSLCFPARDTDAASNTVGGLIRIPNYTQVLERNYTGTWPVAALVKHLPDIITDPSSHEAISNATADGVSVYKYKEPTKNKVDYLLKVSVKNSLQIDTNSVQLVNDADAPGNSYYYGTNGAGTKGYHVLPSYTAITNPLVIDGTILKINPAFSDAHQSFNIESAEYYGKDLKLLAASEATVREVRVLNSSAKVDLRVRAANNSSGVGGDVLIEAGDSGTGGGGSIELIPGSGVSKGNTYIGYNRTLSEAVGRVGIGSEPDGTAMLKVGGDVIAQKVKLSGIAAVSDIETEVPVNGRVVVVTADGELRYGSYAQMKTKVSDSSLFQKSEGIVTLVSSADVLNLTASSLKVNKLSIADISSEGSGEVLVTCLSLDGTIRTRTIAQIKALIDAII